MASRDGGVTGDRVTTGLQGQASGGTPGSPSLGRVTVVDHGEAGRPALQRTVSSCTREQGLTFGFCWFAAVCLAVWGESVGIRSGKRTLGWKHLLPQGAGFREVRPAWS